MEKYNKPVVIANYAVRGIIPLAAIGAAAAGGILPIIGAALAGMAAGAATASTGAAAVAASTAAATTLSAGAVAALSALGGVAAGVAVTKMGNKIVLPNSALALQKNFKPE